MESLRNQAPQSVSQVTNQVFDPQTSPQNPPPSDGRNGKWLQNFGKFERPGSTFHWWIYRPRLYRIPGYSKPVGMAEKANKQELIMDIVTRLTKSGKYTREGMRIEFYRAFHPTDDKKSRHLFTLYPARFVPEPEIINQTWLIQFLQNHYSPPVYYYDPLAELFPTGEPIQSPANTALIPDPQQQASRKDPFDIHRSFKDSDALISYVEKLLHTGHPRGRVEEFYRLKIQAFHSKS